MHESSPAGGVRITVTHESGHSAIAMEMGLVVQCVGIRHPLEPTAGPETDHRGWCPDVRGMVFITGWRGIEGRFIYRREFGRLDLPPHLETRRRLGLRAHALSIVAGPLACR